MMVRPQTGASHSSLDINFDLISCSVIMFNHGDGSHGSSMKNLTCLNVTLKFLKIFLIYIRQTIVGN